MTPLLDVEAIARQLDVSTRTVWRLVADGRLPVVRLGRCARFDPADLSALVAECRVTVAPPALVVLPAIPRSTREAGRSQRRGPRRRPTTLAA